MLGWFKRTFGKKKDEPAAEPVPAEPTVAERAEQLAPPAEVEAVVAAAEPTQSPEPAEVAAEPSGPAAGVEPEILPEAAIPEETEPAPEAAEPEIATAAGETGAAVQADREPEPEPEPEPAEVVAECVKLMRDKIGPVADFKRAVVVDRLPKTRSGKILRGTMVKIADGLDWKMPATIDDPAILDEITDALRTLGLAKG